MERHRFTVVCAADLSDYSSTVLTHALDQAARHPGSALHVVHVIPLHHGWRKASAADLEAAEREAKQRMVAVVDHALGAGDRDKQAMWLHVRRGVPEEQVIELAAEAGADLIVVGRFGAGSGGRRRVGSVADRVIAMSECPVLVIEGSTYAPSEDKDQCPDCVGIRQRSGGETWFCDLHRNGDVVRAASVLVGGPSAGGMW